MHRHLLFSSYLISYFVTFKIYQKSFGDPSHVKGIKNTAMMTIHSHKPRCSLVKSSSRDPSNCAISTINTVPAPYRVKQIQPIETSLK